MLRRQISRHYWLRSASSIWMWDLCNQFFGNLAWWNKMSRSDAYQHMHPLIWHLQDAVYTQRSPILGEKESSCGFLLQRYAYTTATAWGSSEKNYRNSTSCIPNSRILSMNDPQTSPYRLSPSRLRDPNVTRTSPMPVIHSKIIPHQAWGGWLHKMNWHSPRGKLSWKGPHRIIPGQIVFVSLKYNRAVLIQTEFQRMDHWRYFWYTYFQKMWQVGENSLVNFGQ